MSGDEAWALRRADTGGQAVSLPTADIWKSVTPARHQTPLSLRGGSHYPAPNSHSGPTRRQRSENAPPCSSSSLPVKGPEQSGTSALLQPLEPKKGKESLRQSDLLGMEGGQGEFSDTNDLHQVQSQLRQNSDLMQPPVIGRGDGVNFKHRSCARGDHLTTN
ncbi:unnamed protein product [Pleuronectes platessa]|uniref:Uncharacterized protein n=1 Tax=Pleuronectes platessa TaxID=8262 RepID=A0A9N7V1J4_PLEPL|nr:unnamed protein product [Pleuronectes platessa]